LSQSIQLSVSGLYTAPSDYAGLPPGALNAARNVESRHKNILESRRGFEGLPGTAGVGVYAKRLTNFPVDGLDSIIRLSSDGDLEYYDPATDAWVSLDGYVAGLVDPNALAKTRFVRGGQNLYITDQAAVLSLASGSGSKVLYAGVPKGLNLAAVTDGSSSGFFTNNVEASTTGDITNGSPTVSRIADSTGIEVGQYVSATGIPAGTTVTAVSPSEDALITTGDLTGGSTSLTNVVSISGIAAGYYVSGTGIPEGATVVSTAGAGPYTVVISAAAIRTVTAENITFSTPFEVTLSANATATTAGVALSFYVGSQVAYRVLFGRVETDSLGNRTTRYGAPSQIAYATNIAGTSKNTTVTATLPKNAEDLITFVQLYRSQQTDSAEITPLDQMQLVYERNLEAGDFTARVITIDDEAPDSTMGIPLYTGTDREGILQANLPPPSAWDMTVYRNFALYANATQPATLALTLTSVGAPSGLQVGDEITITVDGVAHVYTAVAEGDEDPAAQEFEVVTSGTPSQDIADTVDSLIRVINFDEDCPVHAILTSTATDLPGQFVLEGDLPSTTFTATISANAAAFDPELTNLESEVNSYNNGVFVSKTDEFESVPGANLLRVGDSSSSILRVIALRDYVVVLKTDGIYKILGNTPNNLSAVPFDLTTKLIGPDTAVQLNSGVWMLSNQGVVSIDDSGVNAKSPPIDNLINGLIGSALDGLNDLAFAVGYEADRKYILSVPATSDDTFTSTQYVFNYVTDSWTTWDRNLYTAFIHGDEGKLYISRADGTQNGVSKERKTGTYRDTADEEIAATISSVTSSTAIVLSDVSDVEVGDIIYQAAGVLSPVTAIDLETNTLTMQYASDWTAGACTIIKAIECEIEPKQVFGDNPAFVRQFPEGLLLFKQTGFNEASLEFITDYSQGAESVTLEGTLLTGWGLFTWGSGTWGGVAKPASIRFLVPSQKQLGSYIIPTLTIKQAWSAWKLQGFSFVWHPVSPEVGK
jgi:hypothetical protein